MEYKTDCRFYKTPDGRPYCQWHTSFIQPKHCNPCVYYGPVKTSLSPDEVIEESRIEPERVSEGGLADNPSLQDTLYLLGVEASLPKDITDKLIKD